MVPLIRPPPDHSQPDRAAGDTSIGPPNGSLLRSGKRTSSADAPEHPLRASDHNYQATTGEDRERLHKFRAADDHPHGIPVERNSASWLSLEKGTASTFAYQRFPPPDSIHATTSSMERVDPAHGLA